MIRTIIVCDCGCKKEMEIGDAPVPGAEQIIQITDAMQEKKMFITTECFKKFAAAYKCPYPPQVPAAPVGDLDSMLPGVN